MSRKFRNGKEKETPAVSTAALPDIIFMLLFFFMVAASLKSDNYTKYIKITQPKAEELTSITQKDLLSYIYVGKPNERYEGTYGTDHILLINDKPATLQDIGPYITEEKAKRPANLHDQMMTQLTVDGEAKLSLVQKIKDNLGYAGALKVIYAAALDE